jgi:hypothetical protein
MENAGEQLGLSALLYAFLLGSHHYWTMLLLGQLNQLKTPAETTSFCQN